MKYYRITWGDNNGYVYYITEFSDFVTAFHFVVYVESLGWDVGGFNIIRI